MKTDDCDTSLLGWEIHSIDIKGKIYVKGRFEYDFPLICKSPKVDIHSEEGYAIIYEKNGRKKLILAKILLDKGDAIKAMLG
jgi:hypothetical protein